MPFVISWIVTVYTHVKHTRYRLFHRFGVSLRPLITYGLNGTYPGRNVVSMGERGNGGTSEGS